jgi:kinesin family protein 11
VAKSFQEQMKTRVHTAESKLQAFVAEQTHKFSELHASIDRFVGQKDAEVEQVQRNIAGLEDLIIRHVKAIGELAVNHKDQSDRKLDQFEAAQAYHQEELERKIDAFSTKIHAAFSDLTATVERHRARVSAWTEETRRSVKSTIDSTSAFIQKNNESISDIAKVADDFSIRQVATLYAHQEALTEFLEASKTESAKFQNDLISQVTDMIVSFVKKQNDSTSSVVGTIKQALSTSQKDTSSFMSSMASKTETVRVAASEFNSVFAKSQENVMHSLDAEDAAMGAMCVANKEAADKIHATVSSQSQEVVQHGRARVSDLDQYVRATKVSSSSFLDAHTAQVDATLTETSTQIDSELAEALRQHQSSMREWLDTYGSEVSATKSQNERFGAAYTEDSVSTREQISAFSLREYVPTGTTPQKKTYEHPTNLARTKPKHVLLQEYRRLKSLGQNPINSNGLTLDAMMMMVGGDASVASTPASSVHSSIDQDSSAVGSEDENPLADEVSSNGSSGRSSSLSIKDLASSVPVMTTTMAPAPAPATTTTAAPAAAKAKMPPPAQPAVAKAASKKLPTASSQSQLTKSTSGALAKKTASSMNSAASSSSSSNVVNTKKPALQRAPSKSSLTDATNKL